MHLLRQRRFVALLIGEAFDSMGTWCALIAIWGFAAYKFNSGPAAIALVQFVWALPQVAFAPLAGTVIDRLGPKRVFVIANVMAAVASLSILLSASYPQLLVIAALHGVTAAFSVPALQACTPRLVDDRDLLRANAWLGAAVDSAIMTGPLLATTAISIAGFNAAFVADAATYLIGAAAVAGLKLQDAPAAPTRSTFRADIRAGLAIMRRNQGVRWILALSAPVFLTWSAFFALEPLYVRDVLGAPPSTFAYLQTAFGVGLVGVGILIPRLGERVSTPKAFAVSVILSAVAAVLYLGTRSQAVAFVGVFLWGVDVGFFNAPSITLLQRWTPPDAHGRVMSLRNLANAGARLPALVIGPLLAVRLGISESAWVIGAFALVAGLIGLATASRVTTWADDRPAELAAAALGG